MFLSYFDVFCDGELQEIDTRQASNDQAPEALKLMNFLSDKSSLKL